MPAVLVTATESSLTARGAPSYDAITRALQAARIGTDGSHWVGPGPRVTRLAGVPTLTTTVAALYQWPDSVVVAPVRALVDSVARQFAAAMPTASWSPVTAYPYAEAVNGPLAAWQSGALAVTRTRDSFPFNAGHLDAAENPVGPTTPATHPSTVGETVGGVARETSSLLETVVMAGAVVGVVYLVVRYGGDTE